jgi:glycerophosphoryl diester phosphodiesterase
MQIRIIYIFIFLAVIAVTGCKKINYFPDKPIDAEAPKLIAHRGGRNAIFRENTLEGIKAALRHKDGIEVDVQISKDEHIWLSHSAEVTGCATNFKCFAECRDVDIKAITTCNGSDISYSQLEDVYSFIHDSFPKAYICIDLKAWSPCSGNSAGIEGMMKREAEVIVKLAEKYGLEHNTLVETETSSVLLHVRAINPRVGVYQTAFGDFEKGMLLCLNYGFDGLSYPTHWGETLDKEKMDMLHRKGLKLMAWNLHDGSDVPWLVGIGVDYVQMDL